MPGGSRDSSRFRRILNISVIRVRTALPFSTLFLSQRKRQAPLIHWQNKSETPTIKYKMRKISFLRLSAVAVLAAFLWQIALSGQSSAQQAKEGFADELTQLSNQEKVLKWAFPRLSTDELASLRTRIEWLSSRYRVDLNLAIAVIAAEASYSNTVAYSRKSSIDILRIMSKWSGYGYPRVEEDLENAISSLADVLRGASSTEAALKEYWADPSTSYNMDTLSGFIGRVREKYSYIIQPPREKPRDYKRDVEPFPRTPLLEEESFKVMPNLHAQLVKYDVEDSYKNVALYFNPNLSDEEATLIARSVLTFSMKANGVDPRLVMAVIAAESRFRPRAVSKKGAMGLGQLMPATARSHGIKDPFEPVQNIYVTVRYLEREILRHRGKPNWLDYVLSSYNAGPGAVEKYGGVPPYAETRSFVRVVKNYYYLMAGYGR